MISIGYEWITFAIYEYIRQSGGYSEVELQKGHRNQPLIAVLQ